MLDSYECVVCECSQVACLVTPKCDSAPSKLLLSGAWAEVQKGARIPLACPLKFTLYGCPFVPPAFPVGQTSKSPPTIPVMARDCARYKQGGSRGWSSVSECLLQGDAEASAFQSLDDLLSTRMEQRQQRLCWVVEATSYVP